MRNKIQPGIRVIHELSPDLWPITANSSQVEQVLANLITNACESMADGGTLALRTENMHRQAWACSTHRLHPAGDYVHLTVADTGHGMDDQVKRRIFEPFFSTKFLGRGLGLAVAMGIVRDHSGCIDIESQVDKGTEIHVYLPRADAELVTS
jgi:signal transduction histidine kinase